MSTLSTDNLQNVAGTKAATVSDLVDGRATAWVNFNGTGTVAIRAAFNVSSITDNGVGSYAVNFTTAMANTNYVVAGSVVGATGAGYYCAIESSGVAVSSSSAPFTVKNTVNDTLYDLDSILLVVFGGK